MNNFREDVLRTESSKFELNENGNLTDKDGKEYNPLRLLHAAMGMQTEVAEFTDALKKSLFYGKPLDVVNLKEEIGDALWYIEVALDVLESTTEEEQARVINKLKARYPEKFTTEAALNRDLVKERQILEGTN